MSGDSSEKLRKLLDGELDLSEAANDPILASLASRIYNIDMAIINIDKNQGWKIITVHF